MRVWLGATQGNNNEHEGSGAWEISSTTEMDGSEGKSVGIPSSETVSDWHLGLPWGWLSSESTSLTGEKQRETFTASFLLWDD